MRRKGTSKSEGRKGEGKGGEGGEGEGEVREVDRGWGRWGWGYAAGVGRDTQQPPASQAGRQGSRWGRGGRVLLLECLIITNHGNVHSSSTPALSPTNPQIHPPILSHPTPSCSSSQIFQNEE